KPLARDRRSAPCADMRHRGTLVAAGVPLRMAQVFSASAVLALKLAALGTLGLLGTGMVVAYQYWQGPYPVGVAPPQPIAFSHKHHAGDDGIDCRYCHESVETSAFAGIPATEVCMSCHSQIFAD